MTIKTIFAVLILSGCANFFFNKHIPIRHGQAPPSLASADVAQTPPEPVIDYTDQTPIPKRDLSDVPFKYYTDE
ncbi:MAG TPA: hypothetical protein VLB90_06855, partial [Pseudomonadales bacterium]|nr:hypothetical protein [Pseudomonadales bacterium]